MDGRQELLAYLGTAIVTIVALFGLQIWYATYLDVAVVHAQKDEVPLNPQVAAVREAEAKKLESGSMPIAAAKRALAQRGRAGFPQIAPQPSQDLGPMSGWIQQPGFKPYEPRRPEAPVADANAPAEGAAAGAEAAAAPSAAAPAPAAPAEAAAAPTQEPKP